MKGEISVQTQHIFPVIKRWLYSEKDIFLREIVSNACDAVTKHKRLGDLGKTDDICDSYRIDVNVSKENKTITVSDNGIGMSREDVDNFINKIALSGALDFINKYEGENSDSGIIGHFGLGFYSAFMVSDTVEIKTKSFDGSESVHWSCNADGEFEMETGDRETRGTDVILHLTDEEFAYLDSVKLKGILTKYCGFMPYEIYFSDDENKDGEKINDTTPLWQRNPSDITDEEYIEFYKKTMGDYLDPLMWIHINADYPLNFKGILYFPKQKNDYETLESKVMLYYNQVFVADNIKEVIPEFLMNMKGVLDCPELPLNVSRSYLQTNTYVSKVSNHIAKKVADKINGTFNTNREGLEKIWDDVCVYVQFGCLRDRKFYDRVNGSVLYKTVDDTYVTLDEYFDGAEKKGNVYYASSKELQGYYIDLYKKQNKKVLLMDKVIDVQFNSLLEQQNEGLKFVRVDADLADALGAKNSEDKTTLCEFIKNAVDKKELNINITSLEDDSFPALINIKEDSRRFSDMMKMYGGDTMGIPTEETLVVNSANPLVIRLEKAVEDGDDNANDLAKYLYLLALVSSRTLSGEEMKEFISLGVKLLSK
ncbi:MAG: molecular chaperone HtpG [Clostridia bacterium]|nr:molecular chaperone HtpG [Clostridia bacterium]